MYALSKIKSFRGMEGYGCNATITLDGKAVAFVLDEGNGGQIDIDFTNPLQNAKSFEANHSFADARWDAFKQFAMAWFEASGELAKTRAQWKEWGSTEEYQPTGRDAAEHWINAQLEAYEVKKQLDRSAKKRTLFRIKGEEYKVGEYRTVTSPYSPGVQAFLDKKYPGQVTEIYGVAA